MCMHIYICVALYLGFSMFQVKNVEKHGKAWVRGYVCAPGSLERSCRITVINYMLVFVEDS